MYGVAGETMRWFQSYLADKHQLVYLGGYVPNMALMKHGVPQGRILGPLFNPRIMTYSNDFTTCHKGTGRRCKRVCSAFSLERISFSKNLVYLAYAEFLSFNQIFSFFRNSKIS